MVRTGSVAGPTLAVVAREAGVSVPTASKVVNGREDVAPETRRRVTEALDRLGYVRRPRFDAAKSPGLVDLVVHSLERLLVARSFTGWRRPRRTRALRWWSRRG